MPVPQRRNSLDNPYMRHWDYGTAAVALDALPANGYIANRWKVTNTGWQGNIVKGTTSAATTVPKWLRGVACAQIALTGKTDPATLRLTQTLENGQTYGRSLAVLSLVAFGTAGRHFYAGVNGQYSKVTMKGSGVPVMVDLPFAIPDLATPSLVVDYFKAESAGTFYLPFAQLALGGSTGQAGEYVVPTVDEDLRRISRYSRPIGGGLIGRAASASRIVVPLDFRTAFRAGPSFISTSAAAGFINVNTAAGSSAAAATYTLTNSSPWGARLVIDGFTGLTVGDTYLCTTDQIGVLHADI